MQKKNLQKGCLAMMSLAALGTGLESCSSDDLMEGVNSLPENAIGFNVTQQGALGRGTETNSTNYQTQVKDFQVWAYFAKGATGNGVTEGGRYVGVSDTEGTKVSGNGSGVWNYADPKMQQYWPATSAPLNFQAIAPHSHESFTIENTPDVGDPYLAHLSANVTVPTAVKDQQDIMFAKADNQTRETNSQTVGLEFSHAMSQVVFSGKLASDKIEATVHGIELHNIHQTGKVGYTGAAAELEASVSGDASTTFAAGLNGEPVVNSTTDATVLSATDGALFMLPQTVEKWATTPQNPVPTTDADANHNSYMKVTCTVKDKASNVVLIDRGDIYIPLEVNWEQGKKYRYTLLFGDGENGFKPDGSHDDNLLQIKYDVTTSDWNQVVDSELGIGGGYEKPMPKPLIYKPGTNVRLVYKAEYCKSVIADGKELITGNEYGALIVPELKDEKVYITFKDDVTDFSWAFKTCSALTSIPANLFANCLEATSFYNTFGDCTSLTSIPKGLFNNCPEATDFTLTFSGCTALASLPANLFANLPKVTEFDGTFYGCTSLTSIPADLFANCHAATKFESTFRGCSGLTSLPEGLFSHNPKVTEFGGTFYGCTSLTSIPADLFANCHAATNFESTFRGCSGLTSLPEGLFAHNPNVTDFNGTFSRCKGLTSIPAGLFANCPKVYAFGYDYRTEGTFEGCTSLTSIPEGLFAHNPNVTDFYQTFYGCKSLQSIPSSLFDNNRKATSFYRTFTHCTSLSGESPYTMIDGVKVHLYERKDYPDHFTAPTTFYIPFSGCSGLTDYAQMPERWK